MKVRITHYRVPKALVDLGGEVPAKKGAPNPGLLVRYSRKDKCFYKYGLMTGMKEPYTKGGKTVCEITLDDGSVFIGEALCSMKDNYWYAFGVDTAVNRAIEKMPIGVPFDWTLVHSNWK